MEVLIVLVPFLLLGIGVVFIAFAGSASAAREMYLTRGGRAFGVGILLLYLVLGVVIPATVIANRGEAEGGVGSLRTEEPTPQEQNGKVLFIQSCKSCHNLDAVQAAGVTGPDLDELGGLDSERVIKAIKNGGTGQDLMPAGLLQGEDAEDVATYVANVAGQ